MSNISRKTNETNINLELNVYGRGDIQISTSIGFFDHMLHSLAKHSNWNLKLVCDGDTHVDFHHTVEDVGIVIGQAIKNEIFPIESIERFGNSVVVMDEAAVECDLDISNRPFLVYEIDVHGKVGEFDCELVEEFFRALVINAGLSVHLISKRGKNKHHVIEAAFKAFAVALRRALVKNSSGVPSTKGIL